MRSRSVGRLITAMLCLGACWGCGAAGQGPSAPLIPVKGKVTLKGKPLTKGLVKFDPDGYGRPARGELQSDGTFVLGTNMDGDGVVAGSHRVSISGTGSHPAKEVVPKKYTQRTTSKLTADVDAEHTEFQFDL
jgi:hypothetical protein